jgi:hypothetical protein
LVFSWLLGGCANESSDRDDAIRVSPGADADAAGGAPVERDAGPDAGREPAPECSEDSDCSLVDDCCRCELATAEPAPECLASCEQTECERWDLRPESALCWEGECLLQELRSCLPVHNVSIEERCGEPPECEPGSVQEVDGNGCWTSGRCVPAYLCHVVTGCEDCAPNEICHASVNSGIGVTLGDPIGDAGRGGEEIVQVTFRCDAIDPTCPEATCECSASYCRNGDCVEGSLAEDHPLYEHSIGAVVCYQYDG